MGLKHKKRFKDIFACIGIAIVVTGLVHCALGFILLPNIVHDIIGRGVVGAIEGDINDPHFAFLWYEVSGLAMVAMGILIDWVMRIRKLQPPMLFCAAFLIMGLFLIVLFPQGGAWVLFADSVLLFVGRLASSLHT